MSEDLILLVGALLATAATAGFNAAETVFLSIEPIKLPGRLKRGDFGSERIAYFLERPERYLSTTLAGSNFASVIFSTLSALLLEHLGASELLIMVVTSFFMLLMGETIPKAIARQTSETIAPIIAKFLFFARVSVWPLLWVVEQSVTLLQKMFGLPPTTTGIVYSRADIDHAINLAHRHGGVTLGEAKLIRRLLKLRGRTIGELMTPRTRVTTISSSASYSDAIELAKKSSHKRLVCVGDNPDDVLGVVHSIDLLKGQSSLPEIIRPLPMAPESLPADRLSSWLRQNQTHFAGVLDEYGGFAGVVSIEDLAEELVGPIDDPDKPEQADCVRLTARLWLIKGRTRLSHMAGIVGFEPHESKSATVAGWISELADGIPEEGEEFISGGATVRVVKANPRGALLVRITLPKIDATSKTT